MKTEGQLLPEEGHISNVRSDMPLAPVEPRGVHARPRRHPQMGGEASGRPGDRRGHRERPGHHRRQGRRRRRALQFSRDVGSYRPIEWEEWFGNFDTHECAFVYDNDTTVPASSRYRIVKAAEWKDLLT